MGDIEKRIENALASLRNHSMKGFDRAKETIVHSSSNVKAKIDMAGMNREKRKFLAELGADLIEAINSGSIKTKMFDEAISNISDIDIKIKKKEAELKNIKEESPEGKDQQVEKPKEEEKSENN